MRRKKTWGLANYLERIKHGSEPQLTLGHTLISSVRSRKAAAIQPAVFHPWCFAAHAPLLIFFMLTLLILPSPASKADPAKSFTNSLNSINSVRSGEHIAPPQITFFATAANVNLNVEFELQWQARYARSCSASGAWQGEKETSGTHTVHITEAGPKTFSLSCSGDRGLDSAEVVVIGFSEGIDEWSGTKIPSYLGETPTEFEVFDNSPGVSVAGGPEGLEHQPTDSPGAGKFIFIRVHQATKHGLEWGEQFGWFGSWLSSFGVNSIEGGLWQNPKTAGPYFYPTLHLAGVGDTYHACSDVQMGSGMYERIVGDRWLAMVQVSNQVLTIPGSNIAFDMEQPSFDDDNGIWTGWGWSYLDLEHPRDFKFWMSFVETEDYQGPINGYVPEYFNWVDPEKIAEGSFGETLESYGDDFGTFATKGSEANWGNANEFYVSGTLKISEDVFYTPLPRFPVKKDREYLLAHPQSISQSAIEAYSRQLREGSLEHSLIPTENKEFFAVYQSTHQRLKIIEDVDGEEYRYIVMPKWEVGFDRNLGFVDWDIEDAAERELAVSSNGYGYVRRLPTKWQVEEGASDFYLNHPHQYESEIIGSPDGIVRKPRKTHRVFSYKERDTSHPDFVNWEIGDRPRYQTLLQSGAVATYVWYKFIDQPAIRTAVQNHPETYTEAYLDSLQSHIEALHRLTNSSSKASPEEPIFLNYRGAETPDNKDFHLAKIDPGQLVSAIEGFEVGYVPVVISVMHPEELSKNGVGLQGEPDMPCSNTDWTDTYYPDF